MSTQHTPVINLTVEAPEWSVLTGYTSNGNPENPDRICVWQNGALVVDAVNDEPTYGALTDLTHKANDYARLNGVFSALNKKLEDMHGDFKGFAWDSGAGSSGYDAAIADVQRFLAAALAKSQT